MGYGFARGGSEDEADPVCLKGKGALLTNSAMRDTSEEALRLIPREVLAAGGSVG